MIVFFDSDCDGDGDVHKVHFRGNTYSKLKRPWQLGRFIFYIRGMNFKNQFLSTST